MKETKMMDFISNNRYLLLFILTIVVASGIGLNWLRLNPPQFIVEKLFELQINRTANVDLFEDDALYVITTGTGAPMPDPTRVGPQVVIVANGQKLVFDTGPGSTRNIEVSNIGVGDIDAVFFTHYHSDHIGDLGELFLKRWATDGIAQPLPVYGPPGVEQVVNGFETAYELDRGYRIEHHGEETIPPSGFGGEPIEFDLGTELTSSEVVYEKDGVEVIAFNVDHAPVFPAVGYRVNYQDRSVVISGDTIYTESLVDHAMGADLLVSEVLNHDLSQLVSDLTEDGDDNASEVAEDILDYHISPGQVGEWATRSEVSHVLATHILPPVPVKFLENPFLRDLRNSFNGPVRMANDGTMVIMPVDSDQITYKELIK